mmetsp:Transcript_18014/g.42404  ORF Transcript_18014/g.42404 Transcript_18014/m.42404 type:complete len:201 (+) Transcript_18014:233-835(+)
MLRLPSSSAAIATRPSSRTSWHGWSTANTWRRSVLLRCSGRCAGTPPSSGARVAAPVVGWTPKLQLRSADGRAPSAPTPLCTALFAGGNTAPSPASASSSCDRRCLQARKRRRGPQRVLCRGTTRPAPLARCPSTRRAVATSWTAPTAGATSAGAVARSSKALISGTPAMPAWRAPRSSARLPADCRALSSPGSSPMCSI